MTSLWSTRVRALASVEAFARRQQPVTTGRDHEHKAAQRCLARMETSEDAFWVLVSVIIVCLVVRIVRSVDVVASGTRGEGSAPTRAKFA